MLMGGIAIGRGDLYGAPNLFGNLFESSFVQFGSPHPGSVNFFAADGSSRALNRRTSSEVMATYVVRLTATRLTLADQTVDSKILASVNRCTGFSSASQICFLFA